MGRSKRLLDEKYFESNRLRDEAVVKGDQVTELRQQLSNLEHEIETVKV
jgi:hypothetical protein